MCDLQRESSGGSPESPTGERQSQPNGVPAGPVQTPITTALGLMHKIEGVTRLLGGACSHACTSRTHLHETLCHNLQA